MIVYWGPSNGLTYLWSFLLVLFLLLVKPQWLIPRTIAKRNIFICTGIFLLVMVLSCLINFKQQNDSINNLIWTIITYGSSFIALHIFINIPFAANDLRSVLKFSVGLTLFQIALGYYQMVAVGSFQTLNPFTLSAGAGDSFVGTTFDEGIGNQVAVKISIVAILFFFYWMDRKTIKNTALLIFLGIGWLLPSAIYTLIAGLLALLYEYVIKKLILAFRKLKLSTSVFLFIVVGSILVISFAVMQPDNISYVNTLVTRAYNTATGNYTDSKLGKIVYYKDTFTKLFSENPAAIGLGVGPGNYSSRSAWMVSGAYLNNQPSYIPVTPSHAAERYIFPIWRKENITDTFADASSISYQPFSSWISVLAELGIAGFLPFVGVFFFLGKALNKALRTTSESYRKNFAKGTKVVMIYICILFFIDNQFEWPIVMGQFFILIGVVSNSSTQSVSSSSTISL